MNREGAMRVSDVLLQANGVRDVLLRMAAPANAGDAGEELGLGTPQFNDVPLGAVAWRRSGSDTELVVSASVVDELISSLEFQSAKLLFLAAVGVVVEGAVYVVESCVAMRADDAAYAYRLTLTPPKI